MPVHKAWLPGVVVQARRRWSGGPAPGHDRTNLQTGQPGDGGEGGAWVWESGADSGPEDDTPGPGQYNVAGVGAIGRSGPAFTIRGRVGGKGTGSALLPNPEAPNVPGEGGRGGEGRGWGQRGRGARVLSLRWAAVVKGSVVKQQCPCTWVGRQYS